MLIDLLFYHLVDLGLQLPDLDIDHTLHDTFLLEKIVQVVELEPGCFLLSFCLVHGAKVRRKQFPMLDKIFQKSPYGLLFSSKMQKSRRFCLLFRIFIQREMGC